MHTALLDRPEPWTPRVEDALAFVAEYERARPITYATRAATLAHAAYSVAYTARCEHALEAAGSTPRTAARATLDAFARELLDQGIAR